MLFKIAISESLKRDVITNYGVPWEDFSAVYKKTSIPGGSAVLSNNTVEMFLITKM